MDFDSNVSEKADFNSAISYLNRLNVLLASCDEASIKLDVFTWYHCLMATYRELSTWLNDKQKGECDTKLIVLNNMIMSYLNNPARMKQGVPPSIYMALHKFEMELRNIAQKSGLLMKVMDDAMNALR